MTAISVNNLSFSFGVKPILKNVSFSLEEGDKMGIIGVNGCGKSTLLGLILGELEPDEGNIYISKEKTVGVLTQDGAFEVNELCGNSALEQMYAAFPELLRLEARLSELERELEETEHDREPERHARLAAEFTDLNNRFISGGGLEFRGRAASILMKLGYSEDMMRLDISKLSGGQRTRLALAKQLCREPDILLLDEPTNHLDTETLFWLESFLSGYKKCVIIISHDRYFLDKVTGKTLAIEYCNAKLYNGGYTATTEQRKTDRELAEKHYRDQQKEIARQEAYIAQQRQWNRERNIIAAESRQKLLDKMEKLEKPKEAPKAIKIKFGEALPSGNEVLKARGLAMAFGEHKIFENVDFLIKKNERIFVVGPNGCGKSTLLSIILGKLAPTGGYTELGYNVKIGYYDQENQNLVPTNTVLDELWNTYPNMNEVDIRNALAAFRFYYEDTEKTVSVLSGGERARLTLCQLMLSKI
ncbi:MAG: ABC-F family ATP-binding cassette domain-containing protein, partial [Clostridia bacterium]|nr:ABC-F family ATP-binding cassette domain-containing protein [Clostridia bacterium]